MVQVDLTCFLKDWIISSSNKNKCVPLRYSLIVEYDKWRFLSQCATKYINICSEIEDTQSLECLWIWYKNLVIYGIAFRFYWNGMVPQRCPDHFLQRWTRSTEFVCIWSQFALSVHLLVFQARQGHLLKSEMQGSQLRN